MSPTYTSPAARQIVVYEPAGPLTLSDRDLQLVHTPYYRNSGTVLPSYAVFSAPDSCCTEHSYSLVHTTISTFRPQTYSGYQEKQGHIHSHTHRPITVTLIAHTCRQGENILYEKVPNCCKKYLASTSASVFLLLMKFDRSPPLQYSIIKKM